MQTCTITAREQHCTPGGSASASAASSHAPPAKGLRGGGERVHGCGISHPAPHVHQEERMTCFTTRQAAIASMLARSPALGGPSRHVNQQSFKNIWLDAAIVRRTMWRKESDPSDDEEGADGPGHPWLATLTMGMTEEEYRNMPRSTKAERKAAKAIDRLKCGCAPPA